jgi:replicative DNA helicase
MREPGDDQPDVPLPPTAVEHYQVPTVRTSLGRVFEAASSAKASRGVSCGIEAIDILIGGFRYERVTVLGASTSWGKSSFAVMGLDVGLRQDCSVLVVSGEDPESMYAQRLMARRANVNAMRLRDGMCRPDELSRMAGAAENGEDLPWFLNGIGKPVEWCARAIKHVVENERHDLVIVDYVQAFSCLKKTQDRRNEVTYIFRTFVDVIKASGAAGLILSQLRRLEDNEIPNIHDLKESGDVENGAEHVLLGYHVKPKAVNGVEQEKKRYLLLGKNKDGPTVSEPIEMPFDIMTASFREQRVERVPERERYAEN